MAAAMIDDFKAFWRQGSFVPFPAPQQELSRVLSDGEIVTICIDRERSERSHNHQWAEIAEIWGTLPETLALMPYSASPETLRKHALIATGWCDVGTIVVGSSAAAERVAAYAKSRETDIHGYCVVRQDGGTVIVYTPRSQKKREMGASAFQKSKTDVLNWCLQLIA